MLNFKCKMIENMNKNYEIHAEKQRAEIKGKIPRHGRLMQELLREQCLIS